MYSIRYCTKAGDRVTTREDKGPYSKQEAMELVKKTLAGRHSPIAKEGHTYIVYTN